MEKRECIQCKEAKDLTPFNFYVDRIKGKDGFRAACKMCESKKKGIKQINPDRSEEKKERTRIATLEKLKQQRVVCECGAELRKDGLKRHLSNPPVQHNNYLLKLKRK